MVWLDVQLANDDTTTSFLPQHNLREDETHQKGLEADDTEDNCGLAQILIDL